MSNRVTEIQGEGDPILFVHGLGGTSNVFTPQVAVLQRFFKCVRPDLPGSGRSATPGAIDLVTLADDMAALIEENGGGRWHVVGHSLGTIVCQHLAVRRPDLVRSLVLVGPLLAPLCGIALAPHANPAWRGSPTPSSRAARPPTPRPISRRSRRWCARC